LDQVNQATQGAERQTWFGFLSKLATDHRVKHPTRHGDLESLGQPNNINPIN
jgi:hypothetical protein